MSVAPNTPPAVPPAGSSVFTAFNVGKDVQIQITLHNVLGSIVAASKGVSVQAQMYLSDIGMLEKFDSKPKHSTITAKPISQGGQKAFRDQFDGWEGTFEIIRTGANSDLLINVLQDALLDTSGGAIYSTITQTISDPFGGSNGSTQLTFSDAIITATDAGSYSADSPVVHAFSFQAARRDVKGASVGSLVGAAATAFVTLLSLDGALPKS